MKVVVYVLLFLLIIGIASATTISLDPCGETTTYEQGTGGNAEWVMENGCIRLEMKKNTYDPTTEVYDKQNNRYFRLMANQLEERNNQAPQTSTTTLTSMNLESDIDEGYIRWTTDNFSLGYSLNGNTLKFIGNITGWEYQYPDSDLWIDIRYHKNTGDVLKWIPVIVDGIEQPIVTDNRTAGQNTFISQKLGRGNEIIIDPTYTVDYEPDPANFYTNGDYNGQTYVTFDSPTDVTSTITDNNTGTYVVIDNDSGDSDDVLRVKWNHTYDGISQYFLRFYKSNTGTTTINSFPHQDDNNINTSRQRNIVTTGVGWYNLNVTQDVAYRYNDLGLNTTEFRITTSTISGVTNVAEVFLRAETTDDTPPSINSYATDNANIGCLENFTFTTNVTDNMDVDNVTLQINSQNYTADKNGDEYYKTINPTTNGTTIYTLQKIYAYDLFGNLATNTTSVTTNYTCIYEEYINITHTSTYGVDIYYNESSATINWTTSNPSDSTVTYGLSAGNLNNTEYDSTNTTSHTITLTGLTDTTTYYYNVTSNYNPNQTLGTFNFTTVCMESWVTQYNNITACRTNNTIITQKTYTDTNTCGTNTTLPPDNGTTTENYCNYCDPDWTAHTGGIHDCQVNETRYADYFDANNCYIITNLTEDSPPVDYQTWVSCIFFTQDFDCTFNPDPYDIKKITYTCTLPYTGTEYECINKVTHQATGQLLQTNPDPTTRTDSFLISKEYESRETFTTTLGLLNAYYRNKDILANNDFTITTTCRDGNQTLTHEEGVNPTKKDLHDTANWAIWAGDNAWYLVLLFLVLLVLVFIAGSALREIRRRK